MPIVCQKSVNKGTGDRLFLDNNNYLVHSYTTLSEKQSKFPRYNMKSRGKRDTTHEIFPVVSRFPRYISCYIAESRLPLGQC